jgi:hypothetical protein
MRLVPGSSGCTRRITGGLSPLISLHPSTNMHDGRSMDDEDINFPHRPIPPWLTLDATASRKCDAEVISQPKLK